MKTIDVRSGTISKEDNILKKYLQDINKYPILTVDEEVDLAKKIKEGDEIALNKLVNSNLRFVISVAKHYRVEGIPFMDIIQEGNSGLIYAARKFDESKGFKFISYAVWWIRQSILNALYSQKRNIRVPINKISILYKIKNAIDLFEKENETTPGVEDLAKILNLDKKTIQKVIDLDNDTVSLDKTFDGDSEKTLLDVLGMNDYLNQSGTNKLLTNDDLNTIFKFLTEKEQTILKMYFGLNDNNQEFTLNEIGIELSLSGERVRQIKDEILKKIKVALSNELFLEKYL